MLVRKNPPHFLIHVWMFTFFPSLFFDLHHFLSPCLFVVDPSGITHCLIFCHWYCFFFPPKRLCRLSKTWLYCCWKFHVLWWTIFTAVRLLDYCLDFCWHRQIRGWVWMSFIKFWFQDISLPGSMEWQFSLFLYSFTASLVREQIETKIEEEVKGRITWSLSFCQSVLPDSCRVM